VVDIEIAGVAYPVPSSARDTNWAAKQVAFEQALAATVAHGPAIQRLNVNVAGVGTGANTTEDTLMSYSLPAGTLAAANQGIRVTAWGTGVNTANVTTLRCYFGSTVVVSKVLTASQANTWRAVFEVFGVGASDQTAIGTIENGGTATSIANAEAEPTESVRTGPPPAWVCGRGSGTHSGRANARGT